MKKKRLIVISIDSMVTEDLAVLRSLPNFSEVLADSSIVMRNEATYPTLTHSIHTAISTGCYPGTHGVTGNEHFVPGEMEPAWFEAFDEVKVPSLSAVAKQHGYTVASVLYPLTLNAPFEWVLHRNEHDCPFEEKYNRIRERSMQDVFDELRPYTKDSFNMGPVLSEDQFCTDAIVGLIERHQPEIIYTHIIAIDTIRHQKGMFGQHILDIYRELDRMLGQILDALKKQGLYDKTILNVTADHGHLDIDRVVSINRFLRDEGLITVDEAGNLVDWQAYMHSCALSGHMHIKDHDPALYKKVWDLIDANREALDIERLFTMDEVRAKYHLDGDFDFVIESNGAATFSTDYNAPLCVASGGPDYRYAITTHGHEPWKGIQPLFFVRNPYSATRVVLAKGKIVDQAPTLARMLGFDMPQADGSVREELL